MSKTIRETLNNILLKPKYRDCVNEELLCELTNAIRQLLIEQLRGIEKEHDKNCLYHLPCSGCTCGAAEFNQAIEAAIELINKED